MRPRHFETLAQLFFHKSLYLLKFLLFYHAMKPTTRIFALIRCGSQSVPKASGGTPKKAFPESAFFASNFSQAFYGGPEKVRGLVASFKCIFPGLNRFSKSLGHFVRVNVFDPGEILLTLVKPDVRLLRLTNYVTWNFLDTLIDMYPKNVAVS